MLEIKTNAENVAATFDQMARKIRDQLPTLLDQIGYHLVKDVQDRIESADHGTWLPPSKWTMAKKGVTKALTGAENYVFWRVSGMKLTIFGKTPKNWTLSQHDKGFENFEASADELAALEDGRIRLHIVNPAPLGLPKPGDFMFVPKRAGTTPPRKIWTTPEDAAKITYPVAFRWLSRLVSDTQGVRP